MKPYGEYKETGLAWLERIPKHWEVKKIASLFTERKEKVSDTEFPPLSVTRAGIVPQLESAAKSNDGDNRKKVLKGDFVINSRSDRKGSSGFSPLTGSVSLINLALVPRDTSANDYLHYALKSHSFIEEYYRNGRGIVADLWTTRFSEMKEIQIPVPPREEQDKIVQFLDQKLAKIHTFIENKKKLIALLQEQKQAIINQAVTKGLDPHAEMKDSGVEWLGGVPKRWNFSRLKRLTERIGDGLHGTPVYDESGDYFFINGNNLKNMKIVFTDKTQRVSKSEYEKHAKDFINPTLFLSLNGTVGNLAFYNNEKICLGKSVGYLSGIKNINKEYLCYYLQTSVVKNIFDLSFAGTTINNLSLETLRELFTLVPSSTEQKQIVLFLREKLCILNDIIEKTQQEIDLIQEYKTSLVSAVVTGQVDVRNVLAPTSD